jgi:branched-chain amino acid transport system permease protein
MLQVLFTGLAGGAIYGLVAMGFAIVFYVTRVINFAQGQLLMVAVMVAGALATGGAPPILAILVGILASAFFGVVTYFVAVRPVLAVQKIGFAWLVSTLAVALLIQSFAALIWGPTSRPFPALLLNTNVDVGSVHLSLQEVLAIVVALVAIGIFEGVRRRTLLGKLGMAIAEDPEMAEAVGANTTAAAVIAFAIGGLLAGVAGVLIGPLTYANPYLGNTYGISGFVALMIGGAERPVGAMVGGLLLGVLNEFAVHYIDPQAADWFPFVIVAFVLLLTPQGLFSLGAQLRRSKRVHRVVVAEGVAS